MAIVAVRGSERTARCRAVVLAAAMLGASYRPIVD